VKAPLTPGLLWVLLFAGCASPVAQGPKAGPKARRQLACAIDGEPDEGEEGGVEGGVAGGVLGVIPGAGYAQPQNPLEGARLAGIQLVHSSLGQGARTDGVAIFHAPAGGRLLSLEARSSVEGYGWKASIYDASKGRLPFRVSCKSDRPKHTVDWTFSLVDRDGHRSNEIAMPVECTGGPIPGFAPELTDVSLDSTQLPLHGRTAGHATSSVTHAPFELVASITARGNGWTGRHQESWHDGSFSVGCSNSITPHRIELVFRVRDTYGRESQPITRELVCGDCRKP
jgi:hypothetical protein